MAERKNRRETESSIEIGCEELGFVVEPTRVEVGSAYTLSVSRDENQKPIVDVKTYGQVDIERLRKEILRAFPNAQIRRVNQPNTVTVASKKKKRKRTIK
jgi:hypothetical protein